MKRFDCLKVLASHVKDQLVVVSLGGTIDEWYSLRPSSKNMYLKGMGTITAFSYGLAEALPHRQVVTLDTDGSFLLDFGIITTLANEQPNNLVVFVLDNECHEVVGRHPTHSCGAFDIAGMAHGAGIINVATLQTLEEVDQMVPKALQSGEHWFIVLKVEPGSIAFPENERKRTNGHEDKYNFVRHIEELEEKVIIPREVKSIRFIEGQHNW